MRLIEVRFGAGKNPQVGAIPVLNGRTTYRMIELLAVRRTDVSFLLPAASVGAYYSRAGRRQRRTRNEVR